MGKRINIDEPLWDQSTFIGRWSYFTFIADCRTLFVSEKKLWDAKQFCEDYRKGNVPPGTEMSDIIYAKKLRDGAFHPDTGELIPILARLSCQWPTSILLTTSMLAFQKSTTAMVVIQVLNQLDNALINYTYRGTLHNGDKTTIRNAFLCAVVISSIVTIGCKKAFARRSHTFGRCVPFCAVVAGHATNLPIMRYKELKWGTPLFIREEKEPFMKSRVAAAKGISECLISRIIACLPCLLCVPILTHKLLPRCFSQRRPWFLIPIESGLCAACCMFSIPFALAIFPERNSMSPEWMKLYPSEYENFKESAKEDVDKVYYNKGL